MFFKPYIGSNRTSPCRWNCIHGRYSPLLRTITQGGYLISWESPSPSCSAYLQSCPCGLLTIFLRNWTYPILQILVRMSATSRISVAGSGVRGGWISFFSKCFSRILMELSWQLLEQQNTNLISSRVPHAFVAEENTAGQQGRWILLHTFTHYYTFHVFLLPIIPYFLWHIVTHSYTKSHCFQDCFATILPYPYYLGDPSSFSLLHDKNSVWFGRPDLMFSCVFCPIGGAKDKFKCNLIVFSAFQPLALPSESESPVQSDGDI